MKTFAVISLFASAAFSPAVPRVVTEDFSTLGDFKLPDSRLVISKRGELPRYVSLPADYAVQKFQTSISELYEQNGKDDSRITDCTRKFQVALKSLCLDLDANLDQEKFDAADVNGKYLIANNILEKKGYLLDSVNFKFSKQDGKQAVCSLNLEKIESRFKVEIGKLDFSLTGAKENPFSSAVEFFNTRTVIFPAEGSRVPAPVDCIGFDLTFSRIGIVLSQDQIKYYLPNFSQDKMGELDSRVQTFLKDYGLGRFAFYLSAEKQKNIFPAQIKIAGERVLLRNMLGLHYALQQQKDPGQDVACLVVGMLGVNRDTPENALLSTLSNASIAKVASSYPKMTEVKSTSDIIELFRNDPRVGQEYLDILSQGIVFHLDLIRSESMRRAGKSTN